MEHMRWRGVWAVVPKHGRRGSSVQRLEGSVLRRGSGRLAVAGYVRWVNLRAVATMQCIVSCNGKISVGSGSASKGFVIPTCGRYTFPAVIMGSTFGWCHAMSGVQ